MDAIRPLPSQVNVISGVVDVLRHDSFQVNAIFGFVDIRRFTDTTECLQEETMIFVNSISAIVHECVHRWRGVANKNANSVEAFLVLWKLLEDPLKKSDSANKIADTADRALLSFVKIVAEARRSEKLQSYRNHLKIQQRFGGEYQVKFGLGLHVGWAIEGPIGSDFKVDASYLSPHVNGAMTLEVGRGVGRWFLEVGENVVPTIWELCC